MTMDNRIRDYMLEKHEQLPQIYAWCCICNDPIYVGDLYLQVNDYGCVCNQCTKVKEVAE